MTTRLFTHRGLLQGFTLAALSALLWPELPAAIWVLPLLALLILASYRRWGLVAGGVCGLIWFLLFFNLQLGWLHQLGALGAKHTIDGEVMAWQPHRDGGVLLLRLSRLDQQSIWPRPTLKLFSMTPGTIPVVGQHLVLDATLKPLHGLGNPSGFNQERWLLGIGVTATGTVRQWRVMDKAPEPDWRFRWIARSRELLQPLPHAALILALIFGEQQDVSAEDWQLLRDGGIIHLLAVSGLHIGLAAWLGFWGGRLLQLLPLGRLRVGWLPTTGALLLAILYAALAGFSLPTQRALLMLLLWAGIRIWRRQWSLWRIWWLSLVLLLWLDAWSLFSASFWLSFLAVALLGVGSLLWRRASLWRLQWLMTLGLLPLQLVLFAGMGWLALPINLVTIPLFSVLVIPLGLCSGLLVPWWPQAAFAGFWLCDQLFTWVMGLLSWLQLHLDTWVWFSSHGSLLVMLVWLGGVFWLLPNGRALTCCAAGGALLVSGQPEPNWEVLIIDVGQGLSVLVRQGERGLLYDTGDAMPSGYNLADAAILPLLRAEGIRQLDYLVISHGDRDHASNWQRLDGALPVRQLISSVPLNSMTRPCLRGKPWRWLGLRLQLLAPEQEGSGQENRDSCVLRIDDGQHSLLLVGDLPDSEEHRLLAIPGLLQPVEWLVSGHHGSRHSSTPDWIRRLHPAQVIHSSGYANRWHFPDVAVVARFDAQGVKQWNTAEQGLIRITIEAGTAQISGFRPQAAWYRHLDTWLHGE
jgi:competence protein ComEC